MQVFPRQQLGYLRPCWRLFCDFSISVITSHSIYLGGYSVICQVFTFLLFSTFQPDFVIILPTSSFLYLFVQNFLIQRKNTLSIKNLRPRSSSIFAIFIYKIILSLLVTMSMLAFYDKHKNLLPAFQPGWMMFL